VLNANTVATVNSADGTLTFTTPLNGPGRTLTKVAAGRSHWRRCAAAAGSQRGTVRYPAQWHVQRHQHARHARHHLARGKLDLTNNKLVVFNGKSPR
jgi:hypothetical protein